MEIFLSYNHPVKLFIVFGFCLSLPLFFINLFVIIQSGFVGFDSFYRNTKIGAYLFGYYVKNLKFIFSDYTVIVAPFVLILFPILCSIVDLNGILFYIGIVLYLLAFISAFLVVASIKYRILILVLN